MIGLYAHSNPGRTGPYTCLPHVVEVYHENLAAQRGESAQPAPWVTGSGSDLMAQITVDRVREMFDRVAAAAPIVGDQAPHPSNNHEQAVFLTVTG